MKDQEPTAKSTDSPKRPALFSITRTGILLILIGHLLACVGIFVLMPGGWPWVSPEFIAYRAMPAAIALFLAWSMVKRTGDRRVLAVRLLRDMWWTLVLLCIWRRSPSFVSLAIVSASVGMIMILAGAIGPKEKLSLRTYAMLALAMGLTIIPFTVIQSPLSSTMPIDAPMNFLENPSPARFSIPIGPIARLDPSQASITFSPGRRFVQIEPLLTFNQRSPDGTWTIFARRKDRAPATRRLKGVRSEDGNVCAEYDEKEDNDFVPQARSVLRIRSAATDAFEIEASTSLGRIVYSHLNTFTQITLAGHKQLRIAFSPIPVQRFDVAHAGYPFGKPSQFAFLGADKQLHVVQTSSGEKGPFHELGAGPLDGPLTISFFDGDERLFDVEFADWATQASTEASPAAGWGVPQNAIEFGLLSDDPKSPASVFISLAATSVGRGWSSVGHRAGAYSNRMTVRLAGNPPPSKKVAN